MKKLTIHKKITSAFLLCLASSVMVEAQAQSNFYENKQMTIVVSSAPGGGYDAVGRNVARHIRKHIPGNPTVVVQNMGGVGGLVAANHVYNIVPRDGLTIAQFQNTVPFEPLYGNSQARYEPTKFTLLGSPSRETGLMMIWHASKARTLKDTQESEVILAATGASSTPAFFTRLFVDLFHMKVKLISGYPGQNEQFLGMERGENEGCASTFWSSLKTIRPQWIAENKLRYLFQYGYAPEPELADVPFALDLLKDRPNDAKLLALASAALSLGRPFAAPPNVPADRLAILKTAVMETLKDTEFLADCVKQGIDCNTPMSGDELQKIVNEAYAAPKETIDRLRKIYNTQM
jgi:tripartite-type tricarboxylate transporter receptor subunit TctC